jgi:hypothetical protein
VSELIYLLINSSMSNSGLLRLVVDMISMRSCGLTDEIWEEDWG